MAALIILSIICTGQFFIIFHLINRLLQQAGVQAMTIPLPAKTTKPPEEIKRPPIFSVPLT